MSGENLTNLDGILKDVYENVITEQIATYSPIAEKFEDVTEFEFDGRQAREGVIMGLNEGVGAVAEGGQLPTAGNFDPQQFAIKMRYVYGVFEMTKPMMEGAKTSKGAFKNAMSYSMDSLIRNLKREKARMIWGDGKGILALVNGTATDTTLVVDAPGGVAGAVGGARYLRKGMLIAQVDPANDAESDSIVNFGAITAVASTGLNVTIGSATHTDNRYVTRVSTTGGTTVAGTSYNKEPLGLRALIDDGTYVDTLHGLARSTYAQLKSRVHASVGALSLDAIQLNFDIADQAGDGEIDTLAAHHSVRRAYLALLEADRRYTGSDLKSPDGGTKAVKRNKYVTFGDVPIIEDKYAPYGMLFGMDSRYLKHYVQIKGEWADESGAILRQVGNTDVWNAFYRIFENFHNSRPQSSFRMDGITANAVYVAQF